MKLIGIVLIIVGIASLAYGGFSWTRRDTIVDVGPVQIAQDKTESLPIGPVAGVICLIAGTVVLVSGTRRHSPI